MKAVKPSSMFRSILSCILALCLLICAAVYPVCADDLPVNDGSGTEQEIVEANDLAEVTGETDSAPVTYENDSAGVTDENSGISEPVGATDENSGISEPAGAADNYDGLSAPEELSESSGDPVPDIQELYSQDDQDAAVQEVLPYDLEEYTAETESYKGDSLFTFYYGNYPIGSWFNEKDSIYYFFVPSDTDLSSFSFTSSLTVTGTSAGDITSENIITADLSAGGSLTVSLSDGTQAGLTVMKSDIPSVTISMTDSDLSTLNSGSKDTKYQSLVSYNSSACPLKDVSAEIKGRGNTSWRMAKKGYQIKLDKKQAMLGGDKAKKWLLIPNYCDASMMRSRLAYDFAKQTGMMGATDSDFVDLWIDGQYLGTYLLTEKIEIGSGRVDISDNGVIVEMDEAEYSEEAYYQSAVSGYHYALKDPDADDDGALDKLAYFNSKMTAFEKQLYDGASWSTISSYIDVDSFIRYYFVCELAKNDEAYITGLFYYMDGADDVIHCGPAWDFDTAFGQLYKHASPKGDLLDVPTTFPKDILRWLVEYPEFYQRMVSLWQSSYSSLAASSVNKLKTWENEISSSADMNFIRWDLLGKSNPKGYGLSRFESTFADNVDVLSNWCSDRIQYMNSRYVWSSSKGAKVTGIYIPSAEGASVRAGAVASAPAGTIIKYRWWVYSYSQNAWLTCSQWSTDNWYEPDFPEDGRYRLRAEVKTLASLDPESSIEVDYYYSYTPETIKISGIYIPSKAGTSLNAGVVASYSSELEYNWWIYDVNAGKWIYTTGWRASETFAWSGISTGSYWVHVQVRSKNGSAAETSATAVIDFTKVEPDPQYSVVTKNGVKYLCDANGNTAPAGTPVADGKKYWTDSTGKLQSGWLTIGSYRLYFDPETYAACSNGVYEIDGKKYCFDKNGSLYRNATPVINGKKYYCSSDGVLKTGWLYLGKWKMYFDPDTYAASTGFKEIGGKMYLFNNDGVMQNYAGTTIVNGSKYWFSTDDASLKTGWLTLGNLKLYFDPQTYAAYVNTTKTINGVTYTFDANGVAAAV